MKLELHWYLSCQLPPLRAEGSEKLRQQILINVFFTNEDESHLNKRRF